MFPPALNSIVRPLVRPVVRRSTRGPYQTFALVPNPFPSNGLFPFARSRKEARVLANSERLPISVKSGFHNCPRFDVRRVAMVFVPTEKEKAKIQWFIENFSGEEDDPWLKGMVEVAKAVLEGVH